MDRAETTPRGEPGLLAEAPPDGEPRLRSGGPIPERIRQRLSDLSPSERRVARALLSGPPTIGMESTARLARYAGVSGPTVSRFISGLGFDNYAAFQQALRAEIEAQFRSPAQRHRQQHGENHDGSPQARRARAVGDAVAASIAAIDQQELTQAAGFLTDRSRSVLAAGGWFSQVLADHLVAVLRELRPGVRLVAPEARERAAAIADLRSRDVAVFFDFRRYERDTLAMARAARAARSRIVLFTDPWLSPVAEIADAVLTAHPSGLSPVESLTPAFALVETFIGAVSDALGEPGRRRFERFNGVAEHWIRPWSADDDRPPAETRPAAG